MKTFREIALEEKLTIVKKKWNTSINPDYRVEYNDVQSHDLIPRILDRAKIGLVELGKKMSKAIEYIIKKNEKGFFKRKAMVAMNFTESDFKAMIMINPEDNYIRVSTILSSDMKVKNAVRWDINEEDCEFIELEIEA